MLPCRPDAVKSFPRGRPASGPGNGSVGDDEELLSGPDEAELTSGQLFDSRGVVTQALSLERELSVLPLESCDRFGQLLRLAPNLGGLDESPLAGNRVGQENGGCQDQEKLRQAEPEPGSRVARSDFLGAAPSGA